MIHSHDHTPDPRSQHVPDLIEPRELPVDPDEGPVPGMIPDEHEHERQREHGIDPLLNPAPLDETVRQHDELARCP